MPVVSAICEPTTGQELSAYDEDITGGCTRYAGAAGCMAGRRVKVNECYIIDTQQLFVTWNQLLPYERHMDDDVVHST